MQLIQSPTPPLVRRANALVVQLIVQVCVYIRRKAVETAEIHDRMESIRPLHARHPASFLHFMN